MGLRSWLTPIATYEEFEQVLESIEDNPYANGVHYVIFVEGEGLPFEPGEIIVAWSGDGSASLASLEPESARMNTWVLDSFLDEYPEWHTEPGGPEKFGRVLTSAGDVKTAIRGGEV